MFIKCIKSKRFLLNIESENTNEEIIIEIPCKKCKCIHIFSIYKDKYKLIKSYNK